MGVGACVFVCGQWEWLSAGNGPSVSREIASQIPCASRDYTHTFGGVPRGRASPVGLALRAFLDLERVRHSVRRSISCDTNLWRHAAPR